MCVVNLKVKKVKEILYHFNGFTHLVIEQKYVDKISVCLSRVQKTNFS